MASSLETPAAAADLISFLKALPDCRMSRGVRFPQWWILLVAILAILSGQGARRPPEGDADGPPAEC